MKKKTSGDPTIKTEVDSLSGQNVTLPKSKRTSRAVYFFTAAAVLVVLTTAVIFYFNRAGYPNKPISINFPGEDSLVYDVEVKEPTIKKRFNRIIIRWKKPSADDFSEVVIEKEIPAGKTVLYRGTGTRFVDKQIEENSLYRIYCISNEGYFSRGLVVKLEE